MTRACRPFDKNRDGFVMGEGAGCVIMETLAHAQARGAKLYAEVLGYALNNDAYHMTTSLPTGDSAIEAMRLSIKEAEITREQISYINAHGSSTPINDVTEALAIKNFFGTQPPPISGTKSIHAHPLGATGAIEAVVCCLALEHQYIPGTLNYIDPDPQLPEGIDIVSSKGRAQELSYVLSNSFGFGGINATLVFAAPL